MTVRQASILGGILGVVTAVAGVAAVFAIGEWLAAAGVMQ